MIIIAEKINASIPAVRSMIQQRDEDQLINLSQAQANAGASYIDVNVGTGLGSREDEISDIMWAIDTIQQRLEIPISIDSADPSVLEAGLKVRDGRQSIINSTKAEDESLINILPLAVRYQTPIVALVMDNKGIPKTVEDRLLASKKIVAFCEESGLPLEELYSPGVVIAGGRGLVAQVGVGTYRGQVQEDQAHRQPGQGPASHAPRASGAEPCQPRAQQQERKDHTAASHRNTPKKDGIPVLNLVDDQVGP